MRWLASAMVLVLVIPLTGCVEPGAPPAEITIEGVERGGPDCEHPDPERRAGPGQACDVIDLRFENRGDEDLSSTRLSWWVEGDGGYEGFANRTLGADKIGPGQTETVTVVFYVPQDQRLERLSYSDILGHRHSVNLTLPSY